MGTHKCDLCGKTFYDTEGVFYVAYGSFRMTFCSLSCRNAWQKDNDNFPEEIQRSTNSVAAAQRKEAEAVAKAQREAAKAQRDLAAQQREDMEKDHFRPSIEARVGRPLRLDDIVVNPRNGDFVAKMELEAEQQDARACLIRASGVPASVLKECDGWDKDYKLWCFKTSYNRIPCAPFHLYGQQARAAHLNKAFKDVTEADLKRFERRDDAWWDNENPGNEWEPNSGAHTMRMPESQFPPYIWHQPGEMEQNAASYDASAAYIAAALKKELARGQSAINRRAKEAEQKKEWELYNQSKRAQIMNRAYNASRDAAAQPAPVSPAPAAQFTPKSPTRPAQPAPASPAAAADLSSSVAGLGHEIADQLKSAVKEQLNQLNPFKGLFRKK